MKTFYTDQFVLPLPENHRFPMRKYALLRERVAAELGSCTELLVPHAATEEELLRAHTPDYVRRVIEGALTRREIRLIGFPWTPELV